MSPSWQLGRLGAMVISLHYTWLLVGGVGLWVLALIWLPPLLPTDPAWERWALAGLLVLAYLVGVLGAEALRTAVAGIYSPQWPRNVQLFPFGAATVYPLRTFSARRAGVIALAAPVGLAGLGAVLWGGSRLFILSAPVLAGSLEALAFSYLVVAALHLIPGLPLAGGWALPTAIETVSNDPDVGLDLARRFGLAAVLGLAGAGALAIITENDWGQGLLLVALAWAIREGALVAERRSMTRQTLETLTAGEVMQRPEVTTGPDIPLAEVFRQPGLRQRVSVVPVQDAEGRFLGILPLTLADTIPQGTWLTMPVQQAMTPAADLPTLTPAMPMLAVLSVLAGPAAPLQEGEPRADTTLPALPDYVPVLVDGRLRGMIIREQIADYERLGARAGVQEAVALRRLTARYQLAWVAGLGLFVLAVFGVAVLGNRVIAPALWVPPTPIPLTANAIRFGAPSPAPNAQVPPGTVTLQMTVDVPQPVAALTMTLDGQSIPVTRNPPTATYFTATASPLIQLPGLHNAEIVVETTSGLTNRTEWFFQVDAAASGTPAP